MDENTKGLFAIEEILERRSCFYNKPEKSELHFLITSVQRVCTTNNFLVCYVNLFPATSGAGWALT